MKSSIHILVLIVIGDILLVSGSSQPKFTGNISCANRDPNKPGRIFTPVGAYWVHAFTTYALPIVIVLGVIGNFLSFVILKESALRIPGHMYLCCLTVFDSLSLLLLIPTYWAVLMLRPLHQYDNPNQMSWVEKYMQLWGVCQARMFISFFFRTISIWTIVLFTVERYISVRWPLKGGRICTIRNVIISLVVLCVVSVLLNLPWLFAFDYFVVPCSSGRVICKGNDVLFINRMIEFILFCFLPAAIICFCNGSIVWILRRRTKLVTLHQREALSRMQSSITKRLLAVSFAFLILTLPVLIVIALHTGSEFLDWDDHKTGPLADAFHITFLLFAINLAINFVLYCFTGVGFRRAALSIILCKIEDMRTYRRTLLESGSATNQGATGSSNTKLSEVDDRPLLTRKKSNDSNKLPMARIDIAAKSVVQSGGGGGGSTTCDTSTALNRNSSNYSHESRIGLLPPVKKETSI